MTFVSVREEDKHGDAVDKVLALTLVKVTDRQTDRQTYTGGWH